MAHRSGSLSPWTSYREPSLGFITPPPLFTLAFGELLTLSPPRSPPFGSLHPFPPRSEAGDPLAAPLFLIVLSM